MTPSRLLLFLSVLLSSAAAASAQTTPPPTPPKEPPRLWDVQLGAAFVGTSGNSDTTTLGADLALNRRWTVWKIQATATAVETSDSGTQTAERYLASFRADRKLTPRISLTAGERAERDRFAGIDFRSISDAGVKYALVRQPLWTLDGLTSIGLNHEVPISGPNLNHAIAVLEALSRLVFSATSDSTQRFTFYPDFAESDAYRAEAELTAQAAMNTRLALKVGYLWRYSNAPAFGFVKSDNTGTASIVLRWRSVMLAPAW